MIDVKLRYNTLVKDDHLHWRIIIDGVERTASDVVFSIDIIVYLVYSFLFNLSNFFL